MVDSSKRSSVAIGVAQVVHRMNAENAVVVLSKLNRKRIN
jgi:hypothetical protein